MKNLTKKHTIKIPINISVLYCDDNNVLILSNSFNRKAIKLKTKVILSKDLKTIQVTREPLFDISNNERKRLKAIQGTFIALIKQLMIEISVPLCRKLKLIGVGYKAFLIEAQNDQILQLKLGYSHSIYFKIPQGLNLFTLKSTKLFVTGNSCSSVNQIASLIRLCKLPEPYKGKGILYTTEKIKLKEGKKT